MSEGRWRARAAILSMHERHAAMAAALIALIAGLSTITADPIGIFFDDGVYLLTAKAIAQGQGYVYPHLPGTPLAIHYPPAWPALLAVVWKFAPPFPASVPWFKIINPVLLATAAAGAVLCGRRVFGLPPIVALIAVVAASLFVPLLALTNVLLSEPLFLALFFPAVLACESAVTSQRTADVLVAALLSAAVVLTRTLGGVVVIATVMVLVARRRWIAVTLYAVAVFLLLLPWQLTVARAAPNLPDALRGSYGPYLEWVVDGYRHGGSSLLTAVLAKNLVDAWRSLGIFVAPWLHGAPRQLCAFAAFALGVLGVGTIVARQRAFIAGLTVCGYLAATVAWPYQVDRFLWGIWPLLVLLATVGAVQLVSFARARSVVALRIAAGAVMVLALGHSMYLARALHRGWAGSASRQMTALLSPVLRASLAAPVRDARVLATDGSPMVALYAERQVVPVDILRVEDHVDPGSPARYARALAEIDREFRPDAYVLVNATTRVDSLRAMRPADGRQLVELPSAHENVRAFAVRQR